MVCRNTACLGNYDFDHIISYAIERYINGKNTVDMLNKAKSVIELEEICLVCLLDVEDAEIQRLELSCKYNDASGVPSCREQLRDMIQDKLKCINHEFRFK